LHELCATLALKDRASLKAVRDQAQADAERAGTLSGSMATAIAATISVRSLNASKSRIARSAGTGV
jgi:hypothetical protein